MNLEVRLLFVCWNRDLSEDAAEVYKACVRQTDLLLYTGSDGVPSSLPHFSHCDSSVSTVPCHHAVSL